MTSISLDYQMDRWIVEWSLENAEVWQEVPAYPSHQSLGACLLLVRTILGNVSNLYRCRVRNVETGQTIILF